MYYMMAMQLPFSALAEFLPAWHRSYVAGSFCSASGRVRSADACDIDLYPYRAAEASGEAMLRSAGAVSSSAWVRLVAARGLFNPVATAKDFWHGVGDLLPDDWRLSRTDGFLVDGGRRLSASGLYLSAKQREALKKEIEDRFGVLTDSREILEAFEIALKAAIRLKAVVRTRITAKTSRVATQRHDQVLGYQLNTGVPPPAGADRSSPAAAARPPEQEDHLRESLFRSPRRRPLVDAGLRRPPDGRRRTRLSAYPSASGQPELGGCPRLHPGRAPAGRPLCRPRSWQVGRGLRMARRPGGDATVSRTLLKTRHA